VAISRSKSILPFGSRQSTPLSQLRQHRHWFRYLFSSGTTPPHGLTCPFGQSHRCPQLLICVLGSIRRASAASGNLAVAVSFNRLRASARNLQLSFAVLVVCGIFFRHLSLLGESRSFASPLILLYSAIATNLLSPSSNNPLLPQCRCIEIWQLCLGNSLAVVPVIVPTRFVRFRFPPQPLRISTRQAESSEQTAVFEKPIIPA